MYTGMTNDVARRFAEHQAGRGGRYTRAHPPRALLAAWRFPDRSAAMQAEARFKRLNRLSKDALVEARRPFMDAPFAFDALDAARGRDEADEAPAHRFCPRCGGRLERDASRETFVGVCTVCGRRHYRNAKPCAGALILREGRVLLVQRSRDPFAGWWDIPGGFLELEELPLAGAAREVREETGLELADAAFFGFYIDHYDYQDERYTTLNIYFVARGEGEPFPGDDASACRWFPLDALPEQVAFDHATRALNDLRAAQGREVAR